MEAGIHLKTRARPHCSDLHRRRHQRPAMSPIFARLGHACGFVDASGCWIAFEVLRVLVFSNDTIAR